MRAALDPEVGQAETRSMEKEIHRMKLRFDTLQRDQERMIQEMERAIYKREALALRNRGKKSSELTQHGLIKKSAKLKGAIKKAWRETAGLEEGIKRKSAEMEEVAKQLEVESARYGKLEEDANELQRTINNALYDKQRNADRLAKAQQMNERYSASLEQGEADIPEDQGPSVREQARLAEEKVDTVRGLVNTLRVEFPHLDEVLTRVVHMTED